MSTIDTSTWNPDPALNESIGDIPLNSNASIAQTWQAIQMLMAAGGLHGLQLVTFDGATASADGASGLVPQPLAGDQGKVLKGDGTWAPLSSADIPALDASKLTSGTIDLARLPAGALERLVTVADQTARYALTTADVQLGDTVKQADTGLLYFVVDTDELDNASGYVEYTAGTASAVPWSGVTGKPSSYTPSSHVHGNITSDGKLGTASRAVVTDGDKLIDVSSVTAAELGCLSGVTSAVQSQIDGKLPLTGGTLTGALVFNSNSRITSSGNFTKMSDSASLYLCGGSSGSADKGAFVMLTGSGASSNTGRFLLSTGTAASSTKQLIGLPDGTLTWDGQAIQTASDERFKTDLTAVPDAVLDAWEAVQWGQFKFLDAVERKGEAARLHLGLIAQRVKSVFEAHGLDACAYGILCYEEEEDLWMVRYEEALAMEAACQRRRADRLEARIAALEEATNG